MSGKEKKRTSPLPSHEKITKVQNNSIKRKIYTKEEIIAIIEAYQIKHNTKIWEQRRGFIFEEFANKKLSKWEANQAFIKGVER